VSRQVSAALGALALIAAWAQLGGAPAHQPFAAYMAAHMGVVAIAAPLLALAFAGSRWDPVRRSPRGFSPLGASVVELVVVWAWHTPALHALARQETGALLLEQASFLAAGLYLWLSVLGGDPGAEVTQRRAAGIVALLLTAMHMTLLGALLALAPRPLFESVHAAPGMSELDDQHLGGAVMLILGAASYLVAGVWLSWGLVRYRRV
jgi:putative membrane protein